MMQLDATAATQNFTTKSTPKVHLWSIALPSGTGALNFLVIKRWSSSVLYQTLSVLNTTKPKWQFHCSLGKDIEQSEKQKARVCRRCSVPHIHLKAAAELLKIFNLAITWINFYLHSKILKMGYPFNFNPSMLQRLQYCTQDFKHLHTIFHACSSAAELQLSDQANKH